MPIDQDILERKASELTQSQLFERIVYKIKRKYDFKITDAEAREAARNLIGFTQTLVELSGRDGNVEP